VAEEDLRATLIPFYFRITPPEPRRFNVRMKVESEKLYKREVTADTELIWP
jgi:hypothetical protein